MVERFVHIEEVLGSSPSVTTTLSVVPETLSVSPRKGKNMIYLLIAFINIIYGFLLLHTITAETPGVMIIVIVSVVLLIIGVTGIVLWLKTITHREEEKSDQRESLKGWLKLAITFDIILIVGTIFRIMVLQPYMVEGDSMKNSFYDSETLLVDKLTYKFKVPQRGDVIIFDAPKNPKDDYIKRIIGLPGDTVIINNNKVYVNNSLISEPYLAGDTITNTPNNNGYFKTTLGSDEYFVMGDNRSNSSDSREWGAVPKSNIIGRAWLIVYPTDKIGVVHHIKI